jgi:CheY-like chemotaxis protein
MPEKILVADESPTVRNVAESLLRIHDYTVFLADDGAKALQMAKTHQPNLIFLDDSLSIPDGEGVYLKLKDEERLKDIPVVMLLSGAGKDSQQKLKQTGADGFITKPFNPAEILDQVERLLHKERTFPSEDDRKTGKEHAPYEEEVSEGNKIRKTAVPVGEKKSEDFLDIVKTGDLLDDSNPSAPASDQGMAHGFDWFLNELKKEAQEDVKADSDTEAKPGLSEEEISSEGDEFQKESRIYELSEHEKGYEDFVKDLKHEFERPDKEEVTESKPVDKNEIDLSQFDQLLSDLKERISEKIAREVTQKISPQFLEKIIREELAELKKEMS